MEKVVRDRIEEFIRVNRGEFESDVPDERHTERFMERLNLKIREMISIVPYLLRVAIATVLIFISSIIVWNNYIRKDRHEITLNDKISLTVNKLTKLF
jgi:hypothetical protein